jgi:hypothetical protein
MDTPHPASGGFVSAFSKKSLIYSFSPEPTTIHATLLTGTAYKAGMILGRITAGAVTVGTLQGTGNGTFVIDATNPKRLGIKAGVYRLICVIVHTTHDYTFELRDPDGYALGSYRLTGSGAAITIDNDIKGALTDGGTDFAAGAYFDITVAAGSNKLKQCLAAAEDGSAVPFAILPEDVDATSADKNCPVYATGHFNEEALIYGTGHTADTVRGRFREIGILLSKMKYSG